MSKKTIKTQADFDKQMSEWQDAVRDIVAPLKLKEDELKMELAELKQKKAELDVAREEHKEYWAKICEQEDIRDEKLRCLAEGRVLKLQKARLNLEIRKRVLELYNLQHKRKSETQPLHDKMHEMIMKYPKGTLPLIAR